MRDCCRLAASVSPLTSLTSNVPPGMPRPRISPVTAVASARAALAGPWRRSTPAERGRVLMRAGDPQQLSFIRSALKPFQAQVFVSSGAADQGGHDDRALAIAWLKVPLLAWWLPSAGV